MRGWVDVGVPLRSIALSAITVGAVVPVVPTVPVTRIGTSAFGVMLAVVVLASVLVVPVWTTVIGTAVPALTVVEVVVTEPKGRLVATGVPLTLTSTFAVVPVRALMTRTRDCAVVVSLSLPHPARAKERASRQTNGRAVMKDMDFIGILLLRRGSE